MACEWKYSLGDDDYYMSECGMIYSFKEAGPFYNDFLFCPFCGDDIREVKDFTSCKQPDTADK